MTNLTYAAPTVRSAALAVVLAAMAAPALAEEPDQGETVVTPFWAELLCGHRRRDRTEGDWKLAIIGGRARNRARLSAHIS